MKKGVTGKSRKTHLVYNGLVKLQEQQWMDSTKNALNANEHVRDVLTAEDFLIKMLILVMKSEQNKIEFGFLIQLQQKMYGREPGHETEEKINSLGEERKAVLREWQDKGDWLRQVKNLQLFNREADQLDASISAQTKLLHNLSIGDNLPDGETSLKRHEDFGATLTTQEKKG